MSTSVLTVYTIILSIFAFICLYRAYAGPTTADRVVSINVISTKVTVLIAVIAVFTEQNEFIDVAVIYAMMGFIATIAVSKYIEKGKIY
ncbi:MAG TPA: cation:proton antiporter [Proteiniclasticum sp.]|uniref:monovalent cation/H+ antiporter complex subunit F n=1 Tax=Proteiniclasticum sp. TaxID=2053595 RepID=UPI000E9D4B91|nr:monovalent cation/H+ antiporter complex subunit F [Proteiniclasticum sp.]HBW13477.1 cation:proton antiporter [Proteiniclasticum sp.]